MGPFGIKAINDIVDKAREEVINYYGSLNEYRMGAIGPKKLLPKPESLELYEFLKSSGLRLVDSIALPDQPYLWMVIFSAVGAEAALQEELFRRAQGKE